MRKIKDDGGNSVPNDFQGEYLPIATPLNTSMFFKEKQPDPEPEAEPHFVLPEPHCVLPKPSRTYHIPQFVLPEPQFVLPEPQFVLPQTPSPIPTLSPIPEPQMNTTNTTNEYKEQLSQMVSQNIYDQLLEQQQQCEQYLPYQPYNEQDPLQQPYNEQDPLQQFLTQPETNVCEEEETNDVVMSVITEVLNKPTSRTGKNISLLKKHHCLQEEEEGEEEEKEELRTTTKNNKRFHKHLIFKKKDDIIKKFPILSQKNSDLIVTAENKYKELKSIFVLKKKYIEKNKQLKEYIYGLELVEHRYRCETERLNKNKKIIIF